MEFNFDGTGFSDFFEQYFAGAEGARRGGFAHQGRATHDFSKRGNDVEAEISVSFEEVVHGANRDISLLKTDSAMRQETTHHYQVKIPKGIKEGRRIRLAGQGEVGIGTGAAGDLFINLSIELPKSADAAELNHWEALSNSSKFNPRSE